MRGVCLAITLLAGIPAVAGAATANEDGASPGFATCAAYFFLAARGHGVREYDRHYSAGERALNEAAGRHGREAAERRMETVSGQMMREMQQDWREIARLDTRYGAACEDLLRQSGHSFE